MKPGVARMVAVVGVLAAGCGTNNATQATSTVNSPAQAAVGNAADSGRMTIVYEDATTPEAIRGRELMEKTGLLDALAQDVNDLFALPYDVTLVGGQCGEANDYWSSAEKKMTLCYEDIDYSLQLFRDDPDPEATARRIAVGSFYHELGHMAIDIYDLSVTGRGEDVADQLAAYWLLEPDDNGKVDADTLEAARDTARWYSLNSAAPDGIDEGAFSGVYTVDQSRAYNFECWIYGSDPQGSADIVSSGVLPEDRASGCEEEYDQLARAWSELLEPHYKS